MTTKQRQSILLQRWPAACRVQGWNPNDRALRLRVISQAVGRPVQTMNDLDNAADIDRVYSHLGYLTENLAATVETLPSDHVLLSAGSGHQVQPDDAGFRRRLLWLIRQHGAALGGQPYIMAIAQSKFGLVDGLHTLDDLTTEQLHQLVMTLAARSRSQSRIPRPAPDSDLVPF